MHWSGYFVFDWLWIELSYEVSAHVAVRIPEPCLHELPCWISPSLPSYKTWDGKKAADFRHPRGQFTSSKELGLMRLRKRKCAHSRLIGFCRVLLLSQSLLWDRAVGFHHCFAFSLWWKSCELDLFTDSNTFFSEHATKKTICCPTPS